MATYSREVPWPADEIEEEMEPPISMYIGWAGILPASLYGLNGGTAALGFVVAPHSQERGQSPVPWLHIITLSLSLITEFAGAPIQYSRKLDGRVRVSGGPQTGPLTS